MHFHVFYIIIFLSHTEGKRKNNKHKYKISDIINPDINIPSVLPETYARPVRFDHIGRRGFGDVEFKEPLDLLAYDIEIPKDETERESMLNEGNKMKWFQRKEEPKSFLSPRDEMLYYKNNAKLNKTVPRDQKLYDFSRTLEHNLANQKLRQQKQYFSNKRSSDNVTRKNDTLSKFNNVTNYFHENTFYFKSKNKRMNWTTCDEFAKGALFHPDDIINTLWLPFYIWSSRNFAKAIVHKFMYPNKQIVQYYKTVYGPYIRKLDWKQPKLLLKETREMLLLAGDRKGLFYGIPKQQMSDSMKNLNVKLPVITLRMKIHNPYLALMYCDENYATIMAEIGTEPKTISEKRLEAATLKFTGSGRPVSRNIIEERLSDDLVTKRREQAKSKKFLHIGKDFSG